MVWHRTLAMLSARVQSCQQAQLAVKDIRAHGIQRLAYHVDCASSQPVRTPPAAFAVTIPLCLTHCRADPPQRDDGPTLHVLCCRVLAAVVGPCIGMSTRPGLNPA